MSDQALSLELILRQQKRMNDEFAEFRDQLLVLTAICMRVEASVTSLTIEVRAGHSRHDRLIKRVEALEEKEGHVAS